MDERDDPSVRPDVDGPDDGHGGSRGGWSDEDVRRLLADAHRTPDAEQLPDDVAVRLDEVLAGLVAERADEERQDEERADEERQDEERAQEGPAAAERHDVAVPLSVGHRGRRRRRWVAAAGVAAAAVVGGVVLVATGPAGLGPTSDQRGDDAGTVADVASGDAESADEGAGESAGEGAGATLTADDLPSRAPVSGSVRISSDDPEAGSLALVLQLQAVPAAAAADSTDEEELSADPLRASTLTALTPRRARQVLGCAVEDTTTYAVSYDGRAAQAEVEPTDGDARLVRVLVCDATGEPVEVSRVTLDPTP